MFNNNKSRKKTTVTACNTLKAAENFLNTKDCDNP